MLLRELFILLLLLLPFDVFIAKLLVFRSVDMSEILVGMNEVLEQRLT